MNFFSKHISLIGVFLIFLTCAFFVIFGKVNETALTLENQFYDARSTFLYKHKKKSPNIIVLTIDDHSLKLLGRWPLSRSVWSQVIDKLHLLGAKTIAFDIIFAEEEKICQGISPDKSFAKAIRRFQKTPGRHIILAYSLESHFHEQKDIKRNIANIGENLSISASVESTRPFIFPDTSPIPILLAAQPKLAFVDGQPDSDGVFRKNIILKYEHSVAVPSLSLAAFQQYHAHTAHYHRNKNLHELRLTSKEKVWPLELNARGEARVRFFGNEKNFQSMPIHVFLKTPLEDQALHQTFQDKMIFIGSTALGAHDLRHTPVSATLPGVYSHANTFHMLESQTAFQENTKNINLSLLILLTGTILLVALLKISSPLCHILGLCFLVILTISLDHYYFIPNGYILSLFFILFAFVLSYTWVTLISFIQSAKERKKIRSTFTRYVSPDIVKEMLENPELLKVGGEKKMVSMIFSDIRDFTAISEILSPTELSQLLNQYMGRMTDILFQTKGTLDKYIGDAIVGFWGAPIEMPNHAHQAVSGALAMVEALPKINHAFATQGFPKISMGIGLNTGEVSVGNMGSEKIFAYTALGDQMNLTSRLEGLNKFYGTKLIISENTFKALEEHKNNFSIRSMDIVRVKGRKKTVGIYEVLDSEHCLFGRSNSIEEFNQAYKLYMKKEFQEAQKIFNKLTEEYPQDINSQRMENNCKNYLLCPPSREWDGATTFTSK